MRIIAFLTFGADIQKFLKHIREAQGWGEGVETEPDWDLANQLPADYPDDQRTAW